MPPTDNSAGRCDRRLVLTALGVAAAAVLVLARHAFEGVDGHHDGLLLVPAIEVAAGRVPYRDVFFMYGPLSCWIQAAAVKLAGPTLVSLRGVTLLAYGLAAGLLFLCARRHLPAAGALAVVGLWLLVSPAFHPFVFHSWPSVYAMVFQFAAWYALLAWAGRPAERGRLLVAGVACGLALACKQTVGLPLLGVALVAVAGVEAVGDGPWTGRGRRAAAAVAVLAAGLVAACLPVLAYFAWQGALDDLWRQAWVFPQAVARHYGYASLHAVWRCLSLQDPFAPALELALGLAGLALWRRRGARPLPAPTPPGDPSGEDWRPCLQTSAGESQTPRQGPGRSPGTVPDSVPASGAGVGLAVVVAAALWLVWGDWHSGAWRAPVKLFLTPSWNLFPLSALVLLAWVGRRAWPRGGQGAGADPGLRSAWVTALVALGSWSQYYPVPCQRHGFWAVGPLLVCLVVVVRLWAAGGTGVGAATPGAVPGGRLGPGLAAAVVLAFLVRGPVLSAVRGEAARERASVVLASPPVLAGIRVTPVEAQRIGAVSAALRAATAARPGAGVVLWGEAALPLLYAPGWTYPPPYFLSWPPLLAWDPDLARDRLALMAERRPVVLRQLPRRWDPGTHEPPGVARFLADRHARVWADDRGETEVWVPREPEPSLMPRP